MGSHKTIFRTEPPDSFRIKGAGREGMFFISLLEVLPVPKIVFPGGEKDLIKNQVITGKNILDAGPLPRFNPAQRARQSQTQQSPAVSHPRV